MQVAGAVTLGNACGHFQRHRNGRTLTARRLDYEIFPHAETMVEVLVPSIAEEGLAMDFQNKDAWKFTHPRGRLDAIYILHRACVLLVVVLLWCRVLRYSCNVRVPGQVCSRLTTTHY